MSVHSLRPERSASANSATSAGSHNFIQMSILVNHQFSPVRSDCMTDDRNIPLAGML
jgi:hypothetical protein